MERKSVEVGIDVSCVVACTLELVERGSSSTFCENLTASSFFGSSSDHERVFGDRRKSRDHDFVAAGLLGLPFCKSSSKRRFGRGRIFRSSGKRVCGIL